MRNSFWVGLFAFLSVGCSAPAAPPQTAESPERPATLNAAPSATALQPAQDRQRSGDDADASDAVDFDFYVLSLSWSPTYCSDAGERADPYQCKAKRPYDFVVHGLWPQLESGRIEECAGAAAPLNADFVNSILDIMPSPGLVRHEWRAHGQCSGMSAQKYFAAVRKARALVQIPKAFDQPARDRVTDPDSVERAFIARNKGLEPEGVAVTCSGRKLREVRICLTKTFDFRTCSSVDRRACARDEIVAPASRGG